MANADFFCTNNFPVSQNCFSPAEFLSRGFQAQCPSGNCIADCLDPGSMYNNVSQTMYNSEIPLYAICTASTNVTRQIHDGSVSDDNARMLSEFFSDVNTTSLEQVTATTTNCLAETCLQGRYPKNCQQKCSPSHLLVNNTTPSLQGQQDCLIALCSSTEVLPFADQDIIGVGVSASYVVQGILAVMAWFGFALPDLLRRLRPRSANHSYTRFRETLVETNEDFHKAQCYFDISLSIAALFNFDWPFLSDPVNAYVLMPVMANAVLSPTITYYLIYRYGRRSWYIDILTFINWFLASVVLWGLQDYIRFFGPTAPNLQFEYNLPQAARHLSGIKSCGGSSALNLCIWATGVSPIRNFFDFSYTSALRVPNTIAGIWAVCTAIHLVIFYISISNFVRKIRGRPLRTSSSTQTPATPSSQVPKHLPQKSHTGQIGHAWDLIHEYGSGMTVFLVISAALFVCVGYEAVLFNNMLNFGYVNFSNWSFGQIVAMVVWVPPIVEFLEALFVNYIEMRGKRLTRSLTEAGLQNPKKSALRPLRLQTLGEDGSRAASGIQVQEQRSRETGNNPEQAAEPSRNTSAEASSPEVQRPPRRRTTRFQIGANAV